MCWGSPLLSPTCVTAATMRSKRYVCDTLRLRCNSAAASCTHPCQVQAATPSANDIMSSLPPFASVELKENPTILSCLIESGFYRGPVLKPRPSFAKVSLAVALPVAATLGVARRGLAVKEAEVRWLRSMCCVVDHA